MREDLERSLQERVLAAVHARRPVMGDHEARSDVARYLDPARFDRERARIFRGVPLVLASTADLRTAGDFLTRAIAGAPLLACRDANGRARVFLNVCRHRGTRVVGAACGSAKRFTCPYHAWTYGLDGALVGVPQKEGFPSLERAESGLVELSSEERHGLLWVVLEPGAPLDVAAFLGPLDEELAGLQLEEAEPFASDRRTWGANWKLVVEGGLEAYHFSVAHRATIGALFYDNVFVADALGDHFRAILPKRSMADAGAPGTWALRDHANVLYTIFPNTALLAQADHVTRVGFHPVAPDVTEITIELLVPRGPRGEASTRYWEKNRALTVSTLSEDFALAESIQAGLAAGANAALRFGRFEHQLDELHAIIERYLAT